MTRAELLARLAELKPWLQEQGIVRVRLFGSYARDEAGPDSDVDLLVDFAEKPDLWTFAALMEAMRSKLGCELDLATEPGLHHRLREAIVREAVDA